MSRRKHTRRTHGAITAYTPATAAALRGNEPTVRTLTQPVFVRAAGKRRLQTKNQYSALDRDRKLVARLSVERHGEDEQLRGSRRGLMLALMRDNFRNAPEARTLCEQRALNVVGSVGGRLQLVTPSADWNAAASTWFRSAAAHIEFANGCDFNELLRRIHISLDVGGDLVVLADVPGADGTPAPICGSARLRVFDADEIGNVKPSWFREHFPAHTQSDGLIYDAFGRHVGVIVSTADRGKPTFDPEHALILMRDPESTAPSNWIYLQHAWRPNQGRGVSPFMTVATSLHNIEQIGTAETAAARLNAEMLGCYKRTGKNTDDEETATPEDFEPVLVSDDGTVTSADGTPMSGTAPADTVDPEDAKPEEFPDFNAREKGVFFDIMPEGWDAQMYDTKRPNANVAGFLRYLTGRAAAVLGLGLQYVTLDPQASYSAFRGAQVLARPSLVRAQKYLERTLCDWVATVIITDAVRTGLLAAPPAGTDFSRCLLWTWPKQEECDAVDEQNALRLRLANGTASYRELFGPQWRERLADIAAEADELRKHGLVHPMAQTVSGAVVTSDGGRNNNPPPPEGGQKE